MVNRDALLGAEKRAIGWLGELGRNSLMREAAPLLGLYWLYSAVRWLVAYDSPYEAFDNAHKIIQLEQQMGIFVEPIIQRGFINHALGAVNTLGSAAEPKRDTPSVEAATAIPPELTMQITGRIREAAEMGDVSQVNLIAEEMKSQSESLAPVCDQFIQLAADFEFDGILELVKELEESC